MSAFDQTCVTLRALHGRAVQSAPLACSPMHEHAHQVRRLYAIVPQGWQRVQHVLALGGSSACRGPAPTACSISHMQLLQSDSAGTAPADGLCAFKKRSPRQLACSWHAQQPMQQVCIAVCAPANLRDRGAPSAPAPKPSLPLSLPRRTAARAGQVMRTHPAASCA